MEKMTLDMLNEAARRGGSSALTEVGELRPAAGPHALVSPAKYKKGDASTYVFETRFIDGVPTKTVLIDSRTSTANRLEEGIVGACEEGHPVFGIMPKIQVTYSSNGREKTFCDFQLPHRAFDAHVRLGKVEGKNDEKECTMKNQRYIEARNSTPREAWSLFELSPVTVLFGGWDSTRGVNPAKFPSAVVGEIIGVLADQETEAEVLATRRSGARIDPIAAKITLSKKAQQDISFAEGEVTDKVANKLKKGTIGKTSELLLGAIPPGVDVLDGIATSRIIRSYVLSFATLRRLRFGKGAEEDASIRALLAAMALDLIVRNDSELYLRANAHLVEAAPPKVKLDLRGGEVMCVEHMTVKEADSLLEEAFSQARKAAKLDWHGQVFKVEGNPDLVMSAEVEEE